MFRKLFLASAAFALAISPSYAAGWYPGFTGTGQVAPTGTATATPTSSTSGFYGDNSTTNIAPAVFWALLTPYNNAFLNNSVAHSSTGVVGYVVGRGASGGAASGALVTPVYFNSSGALDLSSIAPGTGSTSTNPCAGADANCSWYPCDEIAELAGTACAAPTTSTQAIATRPFFYQQTATNNSQGTSVTAPILGCFGTQFSQLTFSGAPTTQPWGLLGGFVTAAASKGNMMAAGASASSGAALDNTSANSTVLGAGANVTVTAANGNFHIYDVQFNGANGLYAIDGGTPVTANMGTNALAASTTAFFCENAASSATTATAGFTGQSFGMAVIGPGQTAASMQAANKLLSTAFNQGF